MKMAREKIKCHVVTLGFSVALSLAAVAAASAAPRSAEAGFGAGVAAVPARNNGYSAYAPGPVYVPSYYDYYGVAYYGDDNTVLARPAFPSGCGAGAPHC
jgi:hypothetical protein